MTRTIFIQDTATMVIEANDHGVDIGVAWFTPGDRWDRNHGETIAGVRCHTQLTPGKDSAQGVPPDVALRHLAHIFRASKSSAYWVTPAYIKGLIRGLLAETKAKVGPTVAEAVSTFGLLTRSPEFYDREGRRILEAQHKGRTMANVRR